MTSPVSRFTEHFDVLPPLLTPGTPGTPITPATAGPATPSSPFSPHFCMDDASDTYFKTVDHDALTTSSSCVSLSSDETKKQSTQRLHKLKRLLFGDKKQETLQLRLPERKSQESSTKIQ
ncbi:hypothetical protein EC973_007265 [Apophysomyces ossiformis]|uniref:Uncharacterized protein n=1 Tax=Apophysomyces ossiformis TaxID=679940 RepID=A0A8H7EPY9_9FUNG|nr:hypothetical protein EC973_007265 [Apophysomyces ossiformis]